jgi:hypothetical protein
MVGKTIRIYNMDCVEGAKQYIPDSSVDLLIADPPFSIDEKRLARFYTKYPERVIPGYVFAPEGYPPKPGHFVSSITYREGLMALPRPGQLIDLC